MDIPGKGSCRIIIILITVATIRASTFGGDKDAVGTLRESYSVSSLSGDEDREKVISCLEQAAGSCDDKRIEARIKYRIGILCFRSSSLDKALGYFEQALQIPDCDDFVRMCSLNMTAQIYRMKAKDNEALDAFQELIQFSDDYFHAEPANTDASFALKLNVTAGFSSAEIYQHRHNYGSAISEYRRVMAALKKNNTPPASSYLPLAADRISQLNLMSGNIKGFLQAAGHLIREYPNYYRTPAAEFEAEAVRILSDEYGDAAFPTGSFDAPARLILTVKRTHDKELAQKAIRLLEELSEKYKGSHTTALLRYHQSSLLDAIGQKEDARNAFGSVRKDATANAPEEMNAAVTGTLAGYAVLQRALLLGESGNYKDALDAVSSIKADANNIHLESLAKTVKDTLEKLRNEVPQNSTDR